MNDQDRHCNLKSLLTDLTCERFHKTILQEFYQVVFRKNLYETVVQLQPDLDEWMHHSILNEPTRAKSVAKNTLRNYDRKETNLEGKVYRPNLT